MTSKKERESTGVSSITLPSAEIKYTYERVNEKPDYPGDTYRVVAVVEYSDKPMHKNVYYVDSAELDEFINFHSPETDERIVDIRPISSEQAEKELEEYRDSDGG